MSLELLEDKLFYFSSYVVTDKKILAELNNVSQNIGLIRIWEEGYTTLIRYILVNAYHFDSTFDIDYLHRFVVIHCNKLEDDFSVEEIIELSGESISYIYAATGSVKKTLAIIDKYNLNSNDSRMFKMYFEYTKYFN
jgi:hypothetical protein